MPTFKEDLHLGHSVPTIDTEDIEDGAITEKKMADGSVSTRTIQDGAVTEPKIANRAVTEPKLADWAVSTRTVRDKAISERKLADLSVSTRTMQDKSVTNSKIADSTISMGKLDNDVQTKIQQGTQRAWNPRRTYNENTVYGVNDLVYHTDTNSSYISLQANNQGHNPAWQSATGRWWMLVVGGDEINEIINTFDKLEDTIERNEAERTSRGSWDSTETYQKGNVVYHEPTDSSYMSTIDDNTTVPAGELNENWQLLISGSDIGKKDIKKYPIPQTGFTYTLKPNIMYEFGYATSLSIDFNSVVMKDGELNEFQFSFLSGETATTLTVPESVVWTSTVSIEANMHYEVNILYNELSGVYHGIIVGWPISGEEGNNSGQSNNDELIEPIEDAGGMNDKGGE